MNRIRSVKLLKVVILAFSVFVCAQSESFAEEMKDLKSAHRLISAYQRHGVPAPMAADEQLKEITPKDGFAKAKLQVFKTYDDASYVIHDGKVFPIGTSFGGQGVNSLCIAEFAGNGNDHPVLVFAYSWGSGIHRSQIAAFDPKDGKQYPAPISYFAMDDLTVSSLDGHSVDVIARGKKVASVKIVTKPDNKKSLELTLNADAPAWARSSFRQH